MEISLYDTTKISNFNQFRADKSTRTINSSQGSHIQL